MFPVLLAPVPQTQPSQPVSQPPAKASKVPQAVDSERAAQFILMIDEIANNATCQAVQLFVKDGKSAKEQISKTGSFYTTLRAEDPDQIPHGTEVMCVVRQDSSNKWVKECLLILGARQAAIVEGDVPQDMLDRLKTGCP